MIDRVTFENTTFAPLPLKFEAGTPNYAAAACYAPALEFAAAGKTDPSIVPYLMEELPRIEGLHIYGVPSDLSLKVPLFSFTIDGTHPSDLAQIMDKLGVEVRSGHVCAEPLMERYGITGVCRASFAPYNTLEEAETFIKALRRAADMLR